MARWILPSLALLALSACGTDDPPQPLSDAGAIDGGSDAGTADSGPLDSGVELPCTLMGPNLSVPVGATQTATLSGSGWSELTILGAPTGWTATLEGPTLSLKAPYATGPADGPVVIAAQCGDRQAQVELNLESTPLAFTSLRAWVPGSTGPLEREYFSMWIDPDNADRLWVYGGFHYRPAQFTTGHDVWSLDLGSELWTAHADGPDRALPGAHVARLPDGRAFRYGGLNFNALANERDTPFVVHQVSTGTAGLRFEELDVQPRPVAGDYQASFFHHPGTGRIYAVCGLSDAIGAHCDIHAFDPDAHTWSAVAVDGPAPTGRNGHFWAYDPATDRLIVFSGEGYPGTNNCRNCQQDTWALEMGSTPFRWVRLAESGPPIGRRNGAYVLDPLHHRFLVWGGTSDGRTTTPGLWALDLTLGQEAWHEVPTTGDAPIRTSGAAVYDAPRRRIVMGFGNDGPAYADLWSLGL